MSETIDPVFQAKEQLWGVSKNLHGLTEMAGYEHIAPQLEVATRHVNEAYSQLEMAVIKHCGRTKAKEPGETGV